MLSAGLPSADQPAVPSLLDELIEAWDQGASGALRADILMMLRTDLKAAVAGLPPSRRAERLRYEVVERRAQALSRESFALGQAVIDGTIASADAEALGKALPERLEALRLRVSALDDAQGLVAVNRKLGDVFLEAVYAV